MSTVGAPEEYKDLNVGEVEAAYTSTRLFSNSVLRHKRRVSENQQPDSESEEIKPE
jgi:hypothetical protein